MDTSRNAYRVTAQNPGSDVAAETAAALAAASIVFRDSDAAYSNCRYLISLIGIEDHTVTPSVLLLAHSTAHILDIM